MYIILNIVTGNWEVRSCYNSKVIFVHRPVTAVERRIQYPTQGPMIGPHGRPVYSMIEDYAQPTYH